MADDTFEIPAFLRRNTTGETKVAAQTETPAPAKKPHRKMRDAYMATVKIAIPLDTSDPQSYPDAVNAVAKIKDSLPSGATFESEARIGKIEAA